MFDEFDDNQILEIIKNIAYGAGDIIMSHYQKKHEIRQKDNATLVTEADLAANDYIIREIQKYFSEPILSEESVDDSRRLVSDCIWMVDPLDGTGGYVHDSGEFSVLIAKVYKNRPVLAVVYLPYYQTCYWAIKGTGAYTIKRQKPESAKRIYVSDRQMIADMKALISARSYRDYDINIMKKLGISHYDSVDSAGVKYAYISEGIYDLYARHTYKTGEWDVCASDLILHEAGGKLTDYNGQLIQYNQSDPVIKNGYVGSNGYRHEEILKVLRSNLSLDI